MLVLWEVLVVQVMLVEKKQNKKKTRQLLLFVHQNGISTPKRYATPIKGESPRLLVGLI